MPWNTVIVDSGILAVHAALVPTGTAGEVLLFGGDEHWSDQQEPGGDFRKTRLYDVDSHTLVAAAIPSPDSDVFCAGHAAIGDGRLLIVGGTKAWSTGHGHDLAFWGHRRCWLYNPRGRAWTEVASLLPDPAGAGTTGGGRWYPGAVSLANGDVLALFGHVAADDTRHRNASPERYRPAANTWTGLAKLANDAANYAPDFGETDVRFLFFTRTFLLPDGKLFFATPMPTQWAANTSADPEPTDGPHASSAYDLATQDYTNPTAGDLPGYRDWSYPCVLLPLLPTDDYRPRILHCGRAEAQLIDLRDDPVSPSWQAVPTALGINRVNSCAVLLATGQVCLIGGVQTQNPDNDHKPAPEIYEPGIDWATGVYTSNGSWSVNAAETPQLSRNYHSVALLLPNGSVLTAGGNKNAASGNPDTVGIKKIELYEPNYPAGPRPTVSNSPPTVAYGHTFPVTVSNPGTIRRVALLRNASVTHAYDHDQRYVGLQFSHTPGDAHLTVTAPPNGNVAPPGYYMLWVIDDAGRPCARAPFIRVAHQSCTVITDRSTFSQEEVQAKGGGGAAQFDNAVYVQFDGFIHTELTGVPSFTVVWDDDGTPVPSSQFTLVSAPRLLEVNPGNPDVPQRITYPFHVRFPNLNAYSGFSDTRKLRVSFTSGQHTCTQTLDLTHDPNPYLIDIDPAANNPAWLSTDVRVFSIQAGQTKFGTVTQGTNPNQFIRQCLDRLNNPAVNGEALFESLSTSASLDLATAGPPPASVPVYNYAIARVRYRATTTTAQQVKCFFRVFNVAATGLEFDPGTTYDRTPVGPGTVPLLGVRGGEIVSIPFFASERVETVQGQPGAASMTTQPLSTGYEIIDIVPDASGDEVSVYFGCWLDINQTRKRFPLQPAGSDGPWPDAACRSIQELLRGKHLCIVAEVFFQPDLTTFGETPASSDNLSQRNLAVLNSDNPGGPDSHTVMHTLEIKPSDIPSFKEWSPDLAEQPEIALTHLAAFKRTWPDELLVRWHNLPPDSEVELVFSDIDVAEIQALAVLRHSPLPCTVVNKHTLRLPVSQASWLPIPGGRELNIPALLSIQLPAGVVYGQEFRVSVHQVSGRTRRIIGSCEFQINVSKAELIAGDEARTLSVFKHILSTIPPDNRWYPLIQRYVHHLGVKLDALGGDAGQVHGNPDGSGRPYEPDGDRKECGHCGHRSCCRCCRCGRTAETSGGWRRRGCLHALIEWLRR